MLFFFIKGKKVVSGKNPA